MAKSPTGNFTLALGAAHASASGSKIKNNPTVLRGVRDVYREGGLLFCDVQGAPCMNVHLINPSSVSFGTAVITPRCEYVRAAATPESFGDPILAHDTLYQMDPLQIHARDALGTGIPPPNAV